MINILNIIGNTPVVKIDLGTKNTFLAKLEYLNPGGSLKDRLALFFIDYAEKNNLLKPGGTIIEASSGNQGIALAMIGAIKKYKVIITVSKKISIEKINTLKAYGAKVIICPNVASISSPNSCYSKALKLSKVTPNSFFVNQYKHALSYMPHYLTTGPEIWKQTNGKITHFFAGMGSCSTAIGVSKYLKEQNPKIITIGIDSINSTYSSKKPKPYKVEGIGIDIINSNLDFSLIDKIIPITDKDAFSMTKDLAKKGFLVGLSSGAVVKVALEYSKKMVKSDVGLVIFGDSGRSYLDKVFND